MGQDRLLLGQSCSHRRGHCSGRAEGAGHRQDWGMLRCWDSHSAAASCPVRREPRTRAQPLWNALPSPLPCFSTVCPSALSQCSSHPDLCWSALSAPAPSPCCQVSIKHTPHSLHLLEMSFARDVQCVCTPNNGCFYPLLWFLVSRRALAAAIPISSALTALGAPSCPGAAAAAASCPAQLPWSCTSASTAL